MDNVAIARNTGLGTRIPQAFGSVVIGTCLVALLCCVFGPLWETNDDVGMSMIAGGYGLATVGSPKIIFSNVLWGHLIRVIPTVDRTPGYSIATLVVLIVVASGIIYSMRRLGLVYAESVVIAILLLARPILLPQFTMNAGLLALVGVAFWCIYAQCYELRFLLLGCVALVLGFWVRNTECVLILFVAAPLLPWRELRAKRAPKIMAGVLISALVASSIIDHEAYQKPEWRSFNDLNLVRSAFTDFGAGASLQKRPDILARHGYTENDLELIESWFFVDPELAKPARLQALVRDLGPIPAETMAPQNTRLALTSLWDRALLPIFLAALLFSILMPSRRIFMCWGLGVAAILIMGVIGRPAIMRVYIPLVSMLVVAPFLARSTKRTLSRNTLAVVLFLMALNSFFLISDFEEIKQNSEDVTEG